jgi:thioredoxin-like negative regulator of GroEL
LTREVFPREEFKQMGKYFVFMKVDADQNPALMRRFGVSAMPTIKFLKNDGSVVHEFLGFRPLDQFLAEMNKAKAAAGL